MDSPQYLGDGYDIIYQTGSSIEDIYVKMSKKLRAGNCSAIAVTFWDVGKFLVGEANKPCDLRQIPAGSVTQIPARGGYTAAGPIMRQKWLASYHGADWANITGAWDSTMCSYVATAALGMLIREFEGRDSDYPIKIARATQLSAAKSATCQADGSPQPTRAENIVVRESRDSNS